MLGDLIPRVLGKTFAGLEVKIWLAIAVFLAGVAFVVIQVADNAVEDTLDTAKDAGAAAAVIEGQRDVLTQVERAEDAEDEIRRSGDATAYERCMRYATSDTRANCEPLRPLLD